MVVASLKYFLKNFWHQNSQRGQATTQQEKAFGKMMVAR
jgi:hypothetical protein